MRVVTAAEASETNDYDAAQVHESLLWVVVCHRAGLDSQEALSAACLPPGTSAGRWVFVPREELPEGWWEGDGAAAASPTADPHDAPYPQPCGNHPDTHVHVLGTC